MLKQSLRLIAILCFAFFGSLLWIANALGANPPDFVPDHVVSDNKVIYLLSNHNKTIYRWSIATGTYLSPLAVGFLRDGVEYLPTTMEIVAGHSRLYLGYATGDIRYFPLSGTATAKTLTTTAMPIRHLAAAGKYLIAVDGTSEYVGNRYSLSNRGVILDQDTRNLNDRHTWSQADSKLYFSQGNYISRGTIDQRNGKFDWNTWHVHFSYNFNTSNPLLSIAPDGRFLLASDGAIIDTKTAVEAVRLNKAPHAGKILANGSVVSLAPKGFLFESQSYLLEMYDAGLRLVEQLELPGEVINIYGDTAKFAVLMVNNNKLVIHTYIPKSDSDGDGVSNTSDAFPLDAAASRDTDKDGYPDAWNKNKNASSSTTGLVLDAYPKDAECQLLAQGDGKLCNYAATVPYFTPDAVVSDGKIAYLLSVNNKKIYRWSIDKGTYISPLKVGITDGYLQLFPTTLAFSEEQNRLYLGYANGVVNSVQTSGTATEKLFTKVTRAVWRIMPAGKMVVIQDQTHRYSFDSKAVQKDSKQQYPDFAKSVWDKINSRVYFLNVYSNYQFYYFSVNQTSGKISSVIASPFNINNELGSSLILSPKAGEIMLGNGDIYKAQDLTLLRSLGRRVDAAKWLADGSIVLAYRQDQQLVISRIDQNNQLLETTGFDGESILGLFGTDKTMNLLAIKNGRVVSYSYTPKDDIDGDKVPNAQDAFPNDPAASVDSDNDGYPDAWNRGYSQSKSTTGLILDAYPNDAACALLTDGDGVQCDYAAKVPAFIPDQTLSEGDIIYLLSKANGRIYRWSITTGNFINPLVVGTREGVNTLAPTSMSVSSDHQRLYLGYTNGQINYIDLNGVKEKPFAVTLVGHQQVVAVGKYLFIDSGNSYSSRSQFGIYDKNGTSTFIGNNFYTSYSFGWDAVNSTLYSYRDNVSPNDLLFRVVDQSNGTITASGETPYHGSYLIKAPIRPSADGKLVLLGSGDFYEQTQLQWAGSLGTQIEDAKWLADNSLVTIKNIDDQIILQRRDTGLKVVEQVSFTGLGLGIFGSDSTMVVLALDDDGKIKGHFYTPSDDSDGDGVGNSIDAFPTDPAAAVDTDNDGYPDAWNPGKNAGDSTSNLTLDAYPEDSACYLSAHGDGTYCDYAATMPNFIPEQIASDGEIIYYFSSANYRIYRWSIDEAKFINPWVIGVPQGFTRIAPRKMALSLAHGRVYLGYESGQIRYIDINGVKENEFTSVAMSVNGLAAVGDYLLAQDNSGAWSTHYIFNAAGALTDSKDWNYYSHEYAWDAANSRVYFFRDDSSPNDLHFEVIDPISGKITQEGETPYHGAYDTSGVIRVSLNGVYVLLGSGDIYNASGLTWATSVGAITDARWLADNSLVTVKNEAGHFVVERRDSNLKVVEQKVFVGKALGIFGSDSAMALAALVDGKISAYSYAPSDDSDNDGVENILDAFPLDPAASVDSDKDGYPDSWNPGYSEVDSISNLTLDAYPQDSACYLPAHGDGTACNYGATIPNFTPDQVASDTEYIYLLSSANQRIYRWSLVEANYVNPLVIGQKQGLTTYLPTKMALSESHNRIYLGYESGAIRYLDLQTGQELPFANTAQAVKGLASVGNYVLAQDYSGAWATHYIFDEFGSITDAREWNYYSPEYAWSPLDSRVYYTSNFSPADLHFETVDQTTGKITQVGEAPYHGQYTIRPPIRVAPSGLQVLLGSGDIYRASDLSHQQNLGALVEDALWTSAVLTTLENNQLKVRSPEDFSVLQSFSISGTALRVVASGQDVVVIHSVDGVIQFSHYEVGDKDGDGMPKWWEQANGFDDDYSGDAVLDLDGDMLTNLEEFQAKAKPDQVDTDSDGINDGEEVKVYFTSPIKVDSDVDGLNDFEEVFAHQTDPLNADTDGDGFTDYAEVIVYSSDPKNAASTPAAITHLQESFEGAVLSPLWIATTNSKANWSIDTSSAAAGVNSIRSGAIGHGEQSAIVFEGFFAAGSLSFYARVDAEGCCDRLELYVDGEWRLAVSGYASTWAEYSVPLTSGNHKIEWRYVKDGSVVWGADAAWIDQVQFTVN
uniref:hypothetical protein n=1 Tax=Cellvibrio fontiphilus TaxID=1815559 RepID=UPI002B4BF865|nr:hypothetical protein [Cellvibrio fontiphilus]